MDKSLQGQWTGAWSVAWFTVMLWAGHLSAAELLAHYSFNEGHGNVVRDRSGAGRAARNLGATYVESPLGYALRFDGIDDQVTYGKADAVVGDIDDLMLFKGALTASDVRTMATTQTDVQRHVDAQIHPQLPPATNVGGPVSRDGLVAHYTFEEGQGERLLDHSGRGHHGEIHGADWIESPWGHALHFDGQDDWVNLGQSQDFWFTDSLTIEMWIRTEPDYPARKHPLLIGSAAADLAVERHINVRLDHTQHFRVEWGDGNRYSAVLERPWFLDGTWKHLAIVFVSGKACFLYVNGRPILARKISLPLTRTRGDDLHIGGWSHGYLRGDIAEVRLYRRALTAAEIQRNGGTPADQCTPLLQATGAYSYHQKTFLCDLFASAEDLPGHALQARILEPDSNRVVGSAQVLLREVLDGAGHGAARLRIPGESNLDGDLILEMVLRDRDGDVLFRDRADVPYRSPPAWLTPQTGVTHTVLPPYTPCTASEGDGELVVSTWAREHRFGDEGILGQVVTQGRPLLAGPVALTGSVSGQPLNWSSPETTVVSAGPATLHLARRTRSGPLQVQSDITLEYDGFMKIDCVLDADRDTTVERLALEIPLDREAARLLHA